jgi:hypothetical protein
MAEKKPEHPTVKIAGAVSVFIFLSVLMLAVLVPERIAVIGWVVVPMAAMGVALGWIASRNR